MARNLHRPGNDGSFWSEEDDALLREHWAAGLSMGKLGDILGRSRSSVSGRIMRLGLQTKYEGKPDHRPPVRKAPWNPLVDPKPAFLR
jgi:hypothetical protein